MVNDQDVAWAYGDKPSGLSGFTFEFAFLGTAPTGVDSVEPVTTPGIYLSNTLAAVSIKEKAIHTFNEARKQESV